MYNTSFLKQFNWVKNSTNCAKSTIPLKENWTKMESPKKSQGIWNQTGIP